MVFFLTKGHSMIDLMVFVVTLSWVPWHVSTSSYVFS